MRIHSKNAFVFFCTLMSFTFFSSACSKVDMQGQKVSSNKLALTQSQSQSSTTTVGNGNNGNGNNSGTVFSSAGSTAGASSSSGIQQFNGNNSSIMGVPYGCGIGGGTNALGNFPIGVLNANRLSGPRSVALDANSGAVYVADTDRARIATFDSNGIFGIAFGTFGTNHVGQFFSPGSVLLVGGDVYVQDVWNIQKCSAAGVCTIFSSVATGQNYGKMIVDSSGNFLVTDGVETLTKLNAQGQVLSTLTLSNFNPMGLAIDSTGKVYVGGNNGVKKCTPSWGSYVCIDYVTASDPVAGLAISSGYLYIPQNGSVKKCTLTGSCTSITMEMPPMADLKISSDGSIFASSQYGNEILKFNQSGTLLTRFGNNSVVNGQFGTPTGVAKDASGKFYVVDSDAHRVQKFNEDGTYLSQFGGYGNGNGQFKNPSGIALDCAGNVYVVDTGNNRIQKFNASGSYLGQFGSVGALPGSFSNPQSIAINASNEIFISDSNNQRVQKCNSIGVCTNFKAGINFVKALAIDQTGNVYISDMGSMLKCSHSGVCVTFANFQNTDVNGIAIDSTGTIFVVDNHYLLKCTSSASCTRIVDWAAHVGENERVLFPTSVMVDSFGGIFVTERGNHRVQKFNSSGIYQPH